MYIAKSYPVITSSETFLNDTTSLASSTESCKQHGSVNMMPKGGGFTQNKKKSITLSQNAPNRFLFLVESYKM